jgi:hypothetical protein
MDDAKIADNNNPQASRVFTKMREYEVLFVSQVLFVVSS